MDKDICLNSKGVRVVMSSTSWKLCKQLRYNNRWSRVLTVLHMRSAYLVFILEYIIIYYYILAEKPAFHCYDAPFDSGPSMAVRRL